MSRLRSMTVTSIVATLVLHGAALAEDRKAAERYFRAGAKAYAAQSFAAAAANFDEAYQAAPLPEIAFSAAQAYRRLYRVDPNPDHVRRAVAMYQAYLAAVKTGGRVGDAADNLGEMQRELDRLGASARSTGAPLGGRTRIGVNLTFADQAADATALREIGDATGEAARGVTATIDGTPVEPFALVEVSAKEHVIAVSAEGYFPVEKRTVAVDGQASLVEVELKPRPASVTVKTAAGARILVDGRAQASAPNVPLDVPAGKHLFAVLRRGREPLLRELDVTRGQAVTFDAKLVPTAQRRAVPWVLGGAGLLAAGAVTTAILASVHDGNARDVRDQIAAGDRPPSDGDHYDAEVRSRDRYSTATWILGGAAVATGAIGVALYLFDNPSAEGLHVGPVVGGRSAGLTLAGRF